jgi:hypothetical protein
MAAKKKQSTATTASSNKPEESKFSKHAQDDTALAPKSETAEESDLKKVTFIGRILIFLVFPALVGLLGLYMGYIAKRDDPTRELSFDTDFALPFVLALSMCVVIGFQTGGFTSSKAKPLVAWPKVKKRRKVVHKYVVVGQNPDEVDDEDDDEDDDDIPDKDDTAKKTD